MESRIEESVVEAKPAYPALKRSKQTGMVVLFTSWGCGTVVHTGRSKEYALGYYSDKWIPTYTDNWEDFTGEIVLKN